MSNDSTGINLKYDYEYLLHSLVTCQCIKKSCDMLHGYITSREFLSKNNVINTSNYHRLIVQLNYACTHRTLTARCKPYHLNTQPLARSHRGRHIPNQTLCSLSLQLRTLRRHLRNSPTTSQLISARATALRRRVSHLLDMH